MSQKQQEKLARAWMNDCQDPNLWGGLSTIWKDASDVCLRDILKAKAFRSVLSRFKVLCSWDHISKYDHMSDDNSLHWSGLQSFTVSVLCQLHVSPVHLCHPFIILSPFCSWWKIFSDIALYQISNIKWVKVRPAVKTHDWLYLSGNISCSTHSQLWEPLLAFLSL